MIFLNGCKAESCGKYKECQKLGNAVKGCPVELSAKQRNRNDRGKEFEDEVRRSWRLLPHTWRLRIPDGRGGSRPADHLVLVEKVNLLVETKRTDGDRFELAFMEPNQIKGLLDFDKVIERNYGLVFVSFLNEELKRDTAYAFRLRTAMQYMVQHRKKYIGLQELHEGRINCITLPRIDPVNMPDKQPGYRLNEVVTNCKYL